VELLARLDRATGLQVLCGMPTCRGVLARVAVVDDRRLLCMLDGWKHKARGHWTLNNHSVHLQKVATTEVSRGDLAPDQLVGRGRPRNRRPIDRAEERDANRAAFGLSSDNYVIQPWPSGILADCPRCGHVNTLTAAQLRVAPA
jgi:hypothetical protein